MPCVPNAVTQPRVYARSALGTGIYTYARLPHTVLLLPDTGWRRTAVHRYRLAQWLGERAPSRNAACATTSFACRLAAWRHRLTRWYNLSPAWPPLPLPATCPLQTADALCHTCRLLRADRALPAHLVWPGDDPVVPA